MSVDVIILSKDETFGRMVEIELSQRDFTVLKMKSLTSDAARASSNARFAVIDISFDDGMRAARYLEDLPCAYIGFDDELLSIMKNRELPPSQKIFVRPFLIDELLDFVQKILGKRTVAAVLPSDEILPADELEINEASRKVYFKGELVRLTKREYELLLYLMKNRGAVCSRNEIFGMVWGFDYIGDTNVVDVYIRYLRQKIDEKFGVKLIQTARGAGYSIGV